MEKLVILDYSDASVHFFDVDSDADIDEEYIERLGFNCSNCYWMFGENMRIEFHNNVLK